MIGIICRTDKEFREFLNAWVEPNDHRKFKRISRIYDLFGFDFKDIIRIGEYRKLRNHEDIYTYAIGKKVLGCEADLILMDDCKE